MTDTITGTAIGTGSYRYRFQRDWAKLPRWWNFGETDQPGPPRTSVKGAVAANGDVYVLCRAAHPVLVFDADGRFVTLMGRGPVLEFRARADDRSRRQRLDRRLRPAHRDGARADGTLLRTLGMRGAAAPTLYGKPFNMPTGVAFASTGEIFVSDGYGNRRVHCFSSDGELKHSWGEPGVEPGQFALVHFITADAEDRLYVCDRENHRIQIFTTTGEVLAEWTGFDMPSDLAFGRDVIYVAGADGVSIWTKDRRQARAVRPRRTVHRRVQRSRHLARRGREHLPRAIRPCGEQAQPRMITTPSDASHPSCVFAGRSSEVHSVTGMKRGARNW